MDFLFTTLIDFFLWLDRTSQKPLRKVVPDLDQLIADPAGTLAAGPITIGPATRQGTALFGGCLVALLVHCAGMIGFLAYIDNHPIAPAAKPVVLWPIIELAILVAVPVGSYMLLRRFFRGGQLVLAMSGVRLVYRDSVVFCPWILFCVAGSARKLPGNSAALPVAAAAVPEVTQHRGEDTVAFGSAVNTRQIRFISDQEAVLTGLYQAHIRECGDLLLRLGRVLGK
jgi:hypothetical protein